MTKLYLHASTTVPSGTLPSAEQSSLTAADNFEADQTTNRKMDETIGASQTSLANSSTATTNATDYYIGRWVSPKLNQTSISANTWNYKFAAQESNASANFPRNGAGALHVNCYVWRTSNGTKVGTILDGNTATNFEEAGTSETLIEGTFSGAAVSSLNTNDDVIVFEAWARVTQAMGVSYTQTYYFDGTTESSTSSNAAHIETPETISFVSELTRVEKPFIYPFNVQKRIQKAFIYPANIQKRIAKAFIYPANIIKRVQKPFVYPANVLRRVGARCLNFVSANNQYVDCGNHASLWSQALPKFSFSYWVYPTAGWDGSDRRTVQHGIASNGGFGSFISGSVTGRIAFRIRDSSAVTHTATKDTLTLNQWNHIFCRYDNSLGSANMRVYIDAVGGGTDDVTEAINLSAVLRLSDTGGHLQGRMKDFRFWTDALDQTAITQVKNNDPSAPTPNYWLKMTEGTSDPVDTISGTLTGVLTNGTSWIFHAPDAWLGKQFKYVSNIVARVQKAFIYPANIVGRVAKAFIYPFNVVGGLTRVEKPFIYPFNVQKRTSKQFVYPANIQKRVSKLFIYPANIVQRTIKSFIYPANIQQRISKQLVYPANVVKRISKQFVYPANVVARVQKAFVYLANIQKRISKQFVYPSNITVRVVKAFQYPFNVIKRVQKAFVYPFNIIAELERISKSFIYQFNVQKRIQKPFVYPANITVRVSKLFQYPANILARIQKPFIYPSNIVQRIQKAFQYPANITARISKLFTYPANIAARISKQFVYPFNILTELLRVEKAFVYSFNVIQRTSLQFVYPANIIHRTMKAFIYKFNIIQKVKLTRNTGFNVKIQRKIPGIRSFLRGLYDRTGDDGIQR